MSTIDGITVPDDMQWTDEHSSWKVGQVLRTSLTGSLIVHQSARQAGRPLTLESGQEGNAYFGVVSHEILTALLASEATPGAPFDVLLPANPSGMRTFKCLWRREGGNAIVARPVKFIVPYVAGDWFAVTLRLITTE